MLDSSRVHEFFAIDELVDRRRCRDNTNTNSISKESSCPPVVKRISGSRSKECLPTCTLSLKAKLRISFPLAFPSPESFKFDFSEYILYPGQPWMDPRTRTREKRPVFQSRFDLVKNRLIHRWLSNLITREIGLKQTPDNSQFQRLSSSPRKCKMPVRTCSYSNFEAFSSKLHPFIIVSNICHKKFHQFETITQIVLCFVTRRKFTDIKSRIFPRAIYI